jgi:hypothetical protein
MLTSARAEVKTSPRTCPACNGAGEVPGFTEELLPCGACNGFGRCRVEARREGMTYLATCGTDTLDVSNEGESLQGFIDRITSEWDLFDEDLTLWENSTLEGSGPVVVALLRAGPAAQLDVLLMEN